MLTGLAMLAQVLVGVAMLGGGWLLVRAKPTWATPLAVIGLVGVFVCIAMRVYSPMTVRLFGAEIASLTEFTGLIMPAGLFFGAVLPRLSTERDRRAVLILGVLGGAFIIRSGWWMVRPDPPELKDDRWRDDVCLQSTPATCVAASAATLLRAHAIPATEAELVGLTFTDAGGATLTRSVWAIERLLAARGRSDLRVRYQRARLKELESMPKPVMTALGSGWRFDAHMVCVLAVDSRQVVIGDPLSGRRVMTRAAFEDSWRKEVLLLEPIASAHR